jgi:hypothetical protein
MGFQVDVQGYDEVEVGMYTNRFKVWAHLEISSYN